MENKKMRQFQRWIGSLGIRNEQIDILSESQKFLLIEIFEHICPNQLDWNLIETEPKNTYQEISNLNILLGTMRQCGAALSGISGLNLQNGNSTKIVVVLGQLMKIHFLQLKYEQSSEDPQQLKKALKRQRSLDDEIEEWLDGLDFHSEAKVDGTSSSSRVEQPRTEQVNMIASIEELSQEEPTLRGISEKNLRKKFKHVSPLLRDEIITGNEKSLFYLELLKPELGADFSQIKPFKWIEKAKREISELFYHFDRTNKLAQYKSPEDRLESDLGSEDTLSWITKCDSQAKNHLVNVLDGQISIPGLSFNDSLTASIGEFGLSFNYTHSLQTTKQALTGLKEDFSKKLGDEEVFEDNALANLSVSYLDGKFKNLTTRPVQPVSKVSLADVRAKVFQLKQARIQSKQLARNRLKNERLVELDAARDSLTRVQIRNPFDQLKKFDFENFEKACSGLSWVQRVRPIRAKVSRMNIWSIKKALQNKVDHGDSEMGFGNTNQLPLPVGRYEEGSVQFGGLLKSNKLFGTTSSLSFVRRKSIVSSNGNKTGLCELAEKNGNAKFNFEEFYEEERSEESSDMTGLARSFCLDSKIISEISRTRQKQNKDLIQLKKVKSEVESVKKCQMLKKSVFEKRKIKSVKKLDEMKKFYKKIIITKLDRNVNFTKQVESPYQILKVYNKKKRDFQSFPDFIKFYFHK